MARGYPPPYRRGAGRGGWRRGEPVPLYVVPPNDPLGALFAVLGAVRRAGWRYRSELAPVAVAGAVAWAGWRLHTSHPGLWPLLALLTAAAVAGAVWAPRRWPWLRRVPLLERPTERLYLALWLLVGGGWLAAATAAGLSHPPLGAVWLWGTLACGVPWWTNHRRRHKVTVAHTIARWPELTDTVAGLAGSTIVSAARTGWGWTARVVLRRGQTVRAAVDQIASIESALAARPGAIRIEPDPTDARALILHVIESDPHAEPIDWPGLAHPTRDGSIRRPANIGIFEDGSAVLVPLAWRHVLVGGTTGAGKSGLVNVLLAILTGCPDAMVWGVDLKQGMELRPWAPCLHRLATTPEEATAVLRNAVTELDRRAALLGQLGHRLWEPAPDAPALVVVIDEYAELPEEAKASADSIARRGRAVAVTLLVATQRPTQDAMGKGAVRSQMDVRVSLRVRERRDTDLILGQGAYAAGWRPDALTAAGKFLISAPEHTTPRPARGYLLQTADVAAVARRNTAHRPPGAGHHPTTPPTIPRPRDNGENARPPGHLARRGASRTLDADTALRTALRDAGTHGVSVPELVTITGSSRATVYRRLQALARAGHAEQTGDGRWRVADSTAGPM